MRTFPDQATAIKADAAHLARTDRRLGRAARVAGDFPVLLRPPGYATLTWLVLGQQVSIAAARAMFDRLNSTLGGEVTPGGLLGLDDDAMRACGFTRMKAGYARGIAAAITDGTFDIDALSAMGDADALEALTSLRGIGVWTAENYLMWALGRRDLFPAGDLALRVGWQRLTDADDPPTEGQLRRLAAGWAPRRTAASFLIWYFYLGERAGE
ncbi:MAG: DNA-3-methyladenine glycosylase 2 family protein [Actinobacteria bacterium]|nr:DNA-3-methyladenine glycosylase 2 family protein [Actinomycetota bacterium]MBU1494246.1 DNA-3-methyladenine glycosylase 2 family protein [Actinomycetota bacterium]